MKNNKENFQHLEYNLFMEEINKYIFNGELVEIIEATYAYKKISGKLFYNKTLFQDYGGFKYKKSIDLGEVYFCVGKKLQNKLLQIDYYIQQSEKVSSNIKYNKISLKFLKKQLVFTRNSVEIALYGLPFEIGKAGFYIEGSFHTTHLKKLKSLEKLNFGGSIKVKPEEVAACYDFLKYKQLHGYKKQADEIQYFLDKISKYLPKDYSYTYKKRKKIQTFPTLFNLKIHREDYIKIFDHVFQGYNLPQRCLISSVGSIYDGEKFLEIPNKKTYEYKSLKYILKLILHEVMAHTINLENTKKYLGNFRGAHNLEKEEGLAILLEKLFEGEKLENINIIGSFPSLLMGEVCSNKEYKKYLSIFYKDSEKAYLRFKRNYSIKHKGIQHKDATYSRGVLKTKKYLEQGGVFEDLFLGKVSFSELPYLKRLQKIKKNIQTNQPLFIGEMIYFIIYQSYKYNKMISISDFITYMNKKYNFINTGDYYNQYREKNTQKHITEILKILKKYIPDLHTYYLLK